MSVNETYATILQQLENANISYELHEHRPIISARELDASLPFPMDNLLKTVGFRIKDRGFVLAAVQGFDRIDYKALAVTLGVNRRMLRPMGPEEVETEFAMQVGGVCPIPQSDNVVVVVDKKMAACDVVFCGSGLNTVTLAVNMPELLALVSATIAPISK